VNGWTCIECGRTLPREAVYIIDAGPVCRDKLDCWRAQGWDDKPLREERLT